jgi:cytidine deaminase
MDHELFEAAIRARSHAYAPYSHFAVGAAVRAKDGRIFTGCNIENSSYGLTVCAERNAIFAAVKEGVRSISAICITADTPEPVSPCGACRQVMAEFGIQHIFLTNLSGDVKECTLQELLPYSFALDKKEENHEPG